MSTNTACLPSHSVITPIVCLHPMVLSDYRPIGQRMAEPTSLLEEGLSFVDCSPHARNLISQSTFVCSSLLNDLCACDNLLFSPLSCPARLELPISLPGALASSSHGSLTVTPGFGGPC